jgi:hypothetical protein
MSGKSSPPLERRSKRPRRQERSRRFGAAERAPTRSLLIAGAFSVAAHLAVFAALFWPHAAPPPPHASPILVNLVELPKPQPSGLPSTTEVAANSPPKAVQPTSPQPAAPAPAPILAVTTATPDTSDLLSESQLAGATSADNEGVSGGGGGGGCDTAQIVQRALQRDPLVRTAVDAAHRLGKSVMLWNGDWVRSGDQDGKGLSAVREAIIWELAFVPEACRDKRVHGLVLLSLADGSTRFAIGSDDWRWSDLLGVREITSDR